MTHRPVRRRLWIALQVGVAVTVLADYVVIFVIATYSVDPQLHHE